jgi:hypothetical protein
MNFLYKVTAEVNKGVNSLSSKIDGIGKSLTVKKDKYKTFMEMVIDYDYPIEKHFYTTEDGYINCVFRISGPRGTTAANNAQLNQRKPVVIYQHGLLDSGAGICSDGLDSMAFFLVDSGCDLWLNNSRGNRHSKNHKYFDANIHS